MKCNEEEDKAMIEVIKQGNRKEEIKQGITTTHFLFQFLQISVNFFFQLCFHSHFDFCLVSTEFVLLDSIKTFLRSGF